jgi:hypothetical protein
VTAPVQQPRTARRQVRLVVDDQDRGWHRAGHFRVALAAAA